MPLSDTATTAISKLGASARAQVVPVIRDTLRLELFALFATWLSRYLFPSVSQLTISFYIRWYHVIIFYKESEVRKLAYLLYAYELQRDGPPNIGARILAVKLGVPCLVYVLVSVMCHNPVAATLGLVNDMLVVLIIPEVAVSVFLFAIVKRPVKELGEFCGVCWAKGSWILKYGTRVVKFLVWGARQVSLARENTDNCSRYKYKPLNPAQICLLSVRKISGLTDERAATSGQ
jgi:hypothetical protein